MIYSLFKENIYSEYLVKIDMCALRAGYSIHDKEWQFKYHDTYEQYKLFKMLYDNIKPSWFSNVSIYMIKKFLILILFSSYTFQPERLIIYKSHETTNLMKIIDKKCIEIFGQSLASLMSLREDDFDGLSFTDIIIGSPFETIEEFSTQRIIAEVLSEVLFDLKQHKWFIELDRMKLFISKLNGNQKNFRDNFEENLRVVYDYTKFEQFLKNSITRKYQAYAFSEYEKLGKQYNKIINEKVDDYIKELKSDYETSEVIQNEIQRVSRLKSTNLPTPEEEKKLEEYEIGKIEKYTEKYNIGEIGNYIEEFNTNISALERMRRYSKNNERDKLLERIYTTNVDKTENIKGKIKVNPYTCHIQNFLYNDIDVYHSEYYYTNFIIDCNRIAQFFYEDDITICKLILLLSEMIDEIEIEKTKSHGLRAAFGTKFSVDNLGNMTKIKLMKKTDSKKRICNNGSNKIGIIADIKVNVHGKKDDGDKIAKLGTIKCKKMNTKEEMGMYKELNKIGQVCTVILNKSVIFHTVSQ